MYDLSEKIAVFRSAKISNLKLELSYNEFAILIMIVNKKDKLNALQLSQSLYVSKAYVTKVINVLCNKDLVYKNKSEEDKRVYYLTPSKLGISLVTKYMDKYMETTNYLYNCLGDKKANTLKELLNEATEIINKFTKEKNK